MILIKDLTSERVFMFSFGKNRIKVKAYKFFEDKIFEIPRMKFRFKKEIK